MNSFIAQLESNIIYLVLVFIVLIALLTNLIFKFNRVKKNHVNYKTANGYKYKYLKEVELEINRTKFVNELRSFFLGKLKDSVVLIHNTPSQVVANQILNEGFKFSENLHNTTQPISGNLTNLSHILNQYRSYGKQGIIETLENALCDIYPGKNLNYTLPSMFVCGYIDLLSNKIVENDQYLSGYNLKKLKTKIIQKTKI